MMSSYLYCATMASAVLRTSSTLRLTVKFGYVHSSEGIATSSLTQLAVNTASTKQKIRFGIRDFIVIGDLEVNRKAYKIVSSVAVEIFVTKVGCSAGYVLIALPKVGISGLFVTTRFKRSVQNIVDATKQIQVLFENAPRLSPD